MPHFSYNGGRDFIAMWGIFLWLEKKIQKKLMLSVMRIV